MKRSVQAVHFTDHQGLCPEEPMVCGPAGRKALVKIFRGSPVSVCLSVTAMVVCLPSRMFLITTMFIRYMPFSAYVMSRFSSVLTRFPSGS